MILNIKRNLMNSVGLEYRFKGIYEEYDEVTFEEDGSVEKNTKPILSK